MNMKTLAYWVVVYGTLATVLTLVHFYNIDYRYYDRQEEGHNQVLNAQSTHPSSMRVLQPLLVEGFCRCVPFLSRSAGFLLGYSLIRWASIFTTFVVFEQFLRKHASLHAARFAVLFTAAVYPLTYHRYSYQPSSVLDLALFAAGMMMIARGCHWSLLPLIVVGAVNRNTIIFLLGAYGLWHLPGLLRDRRGVVRYLAVCAAMFVSWAAVLLLVERIFPGHGWRGTPGVYVRYNLHVQGVRLLGGVMLIPLVLFVAYAWKRVYLQAKVISLLAIPYIVLHFVMACCDEVRYWLNLYVLLGPFIACGYERLHQQRPDAMWSLAFRPDR